MEQEYTQSQNITLPIEWHISNAVQSRYATNLTVQVGQHEFVVSFFEVLPPLLTGQPEEARSQIEQLKSVRAECVGRIIVAAEQLPSIISVLQSAWDNYQSSRVEE